MHPMNICQKEDISAREIEDNNVAKYGMVTLQLTHP